MSLFWEVVRSKQGPKQGPKQSPKQGPKQGSSGTLNNMKSNK